MHAGPLTESEQTADDSTTRSTAPAGADGGTVASSDSGRTASGGVRVYLELAGTTFTLAYVSLILVGMFHLWLRLWYFDLNALDYADLSDFLLAPARDPLIVLVTIAPLVLGWLYYRLTRRLSRTSEAWLDRRWPKWRKYFPHGDRAEQRAMLAASLMWVIAFSLQYEGKQSRRIKTGDANLLVAVVDGLGDAVDTVRAIQLAQTSRFLIVWTPERESSDIIPIDRIRRITVPRLRGFEADSAATARRTRINSWNARADAGNARYDSVKKSTR